MDPCSVSGLRYLADVAFRASIYFPPRFQCNTLGSDGFILQTAVTTGHSGHQLVVCVQVSSFTHHYSEYGKTFLSIKCVLKHS